MTGPEFVPLARGFFKDDDVRSLSHLAFRVLATLKGLLPLSGIGEIHGWELAQCCACQAGEAEDALQELEAVKPSGEPGWIRREGRVVWLVTGLAHAVGITPRNQNHRAHVRGTLGRLSRQAPGLCQAFAERYMEYVGGEPTRRDPAGDPIRMGSRSHSDQGEVNGEVEQFPLQAESGGVVHTVAAGEPSAPPASASASDQTTASASAVVDRFVTRWYGTAPPSRQRDVRRQIQQALSPAGCVVRRAPREVAKATEASLARAVAACEVAGAVAQADRAVVVLLRKLVSGQCHTVAPPGSEWARDQARERAARQSPPRSPAVQPPSPPPRAASTAGDLAIAQAWIDEHPDIRRRVEREADEAAARLHPRWQTISWLNGVRARHLEEGVLAAYRGQLTVSCLHPLTLTST